ncbi:MAG: DNA-binding protein [Epsilonproteobacteria bacterium]|nr:DNA-binding protein [Campylobacterota bacterium]OIO18012.1 MAG: DNA-binding protein [Helicobacteraceae bacterium CG1_02_36_14]PIP10019.1 MAG: DNA-binding protein [Sulfurimonas sp. CG23_combo_of_CG06-09_8_20_14_all_36_33]PIS26115.1 MAG: DNA-binding protein [Sulfurimonas sp. CG08_land_8_20_14_0_20_36_33]PIU34414.1 MAG: DNA-binding protein [Sulfurimonas sp. CG07_land_8_20_14_0_80_36_56]PIV03253.1 MAG: DNA-binding protein [Sulfurimonas sp. CG03_land_8_20_14_0_80_36_25]PIV36876.1 MAG: DNA-bindi
MPKMNVSDAAEYFGVSKEAIHNRIRRGSLESVVEEGMKFVLVDSAAKASSTQTNKTQTRKTDLSSDNRYSKLLEEQNIKLQTRVERLEDETKSLRDQKEAMLIQERIKIEEIYKQKDEQLKSIIHAISSKFILNSPSDESDSEGAVEAEIEESVVEKQLISLKKYLKDGSYSKKQRVKIKERFKKRANEDSRVIVVGKKYYLNLKHDYSDLL